MAEERKSVLRLENITKKFQGLTAVDDVSFDMKERSIYALIGPNGAGKTTTVNMITGVFPPTTGKIYYRDRCINGMKTFEIARLGIGRTFQNLKLFNSMSVLENLMIGGHEMTKIGLVNFCFNFGGSKKEEILLRERAEEVMEYLGIQDLEKRNVKNLSYGRQKIVELGRAMMTGPKLLLLDEPAAGLIPSERKEFVDIVLRMFEEGMDIFLIEHNMDVVMNVSTYITVLNFGSRIAEGTPKEIQSDPEVIKAYLGDKYQEIAAKERRD